jgi:hypothetical protein
VRSLEATQAERGRSRNTDIRNLGRSDEDDGIRGEEPGGSTPW